MNRHQRRAMTIKGPKGEKLEPQLLEILERGPDGRPTLCRIAYDDEKLGDVAAERPHATRPDGSPSMTFEIVWMAEGQQRKPS